MLTHLDNYRKWKAHLQTPLEALAGRNLLEVFTQQQLQGLQKRRTLEAKLSSMRDIRPLLDDAKLAREDKIDEKPEMAVNGQLNDESTLANENLVTETTKTRDNNSEWEKAVTAEKICESNKISNLQPTTENADLVASPQPQDRELDFITSGTIDTTSHRAPQSDSVPATHTTDSEKEDETPKPIHLTFCDNCKVNLTCLDKLRGVLIAYSLEQRKYRRRSLEMHGV